jgi:hypothetical protein
MVACFAGALLAPGTLAWAQGAKLSADDIARTITGNTVYSEWDGQATAQFFAPDGTSVLELADGRSFEGDWHVDQADHQYCSYHWMRGTRCYDLYWRGKTLMWREEDSDVELASTVSAGRKLFSDGGSGGSQQTSDSNR